MKFYGNNSGVFFLVDLYTELEADIWEKRLGKFYRYTKNEKFVVLRDNVGISNGLTWNEKTNKFYYIDSCDLDVKEFDYDPKTGNICEYTKLKFNFPTRSEQNSRIPSASQ